MLDAGSWGEEKIMSKSLHSADGDFTQNQNNPMSDDPGDGSRNAFTPGKVGNTPV